MRENQIAFPCGLMPFKSDDRLWGYRNPAGEIAIAPQFSYAADFAACGLASVTTDGKKGYINTAGAFVIPPQFQWAFAFRESNVANVRQNGENFYIDTTGTRLPDGAVDEEPDNIRLGLREIRQNGKQGCVNRAGDIAIPPIFDQVWTKWAISEEIPVLVSLDKKKGYVDLRGNIVIELKYDYEDAMPFDECGLASIREGGKWGLIDVTGRFVLPPQFDFMYSYCNGFFPVIANGKWGYLDGTGRVAVAPQFANGSQFGRDGLAIVSVERKEGYIDASGTFVIPAQFTDAKAFQNGLAAVKKDRKCGYIDSSGIVSIPLQFTNAGGFSADGYAVVRTREGQGLIDRTGAWIIPPPCFGLLDNDFFE